MPSINLGRVVGDPGPKGDRGTVWHLGTGVTGQSTTGTVFSGSGVESAALQDMYLNTNTDDFYTCVLAGNAATAKWAYAGNLKGATGPQGATGPTGKVDSNTPVTFETAATETDINSGESLGTLMGKIKKSISTFRSAMGTLSNLGTTVKTSLVDAINELKGETTALNGNIEQVMPSQNFWMEGIGSYTVIIDYSNVESPDLSRIPVLVGGNIANQNFLILYNIDLVNLTQDAKLQTGTNIIAPHEGFKLSANKDAGNTYKLRLKFELSVNYGAHVFVTVYSHGGKVL